MAGQEYYDDLFAHTFRNLMPECSSCVCSNGSLSDARTFESGMLVFASCFCPTNRHVNARKKNETKALAHATKLLARWTKLLIH